MYTLRKDGKKRKNVHITITITRDEFEDFKTRIKAHNLNYTIHEYLLNHVTSKLGYINEEYPITKCLDCNKISAASNKPYYENSCDHCESYNVEIIN